MTNEERVIQFREKQGWPWCGECEFEWAGDYVCPECLKMMKVQEQALDAAEERGRELQTQESYEWANSVDPAIRADERRRVYEKAQQYGEGSGLIDMADLAGICKLEGEDDDE